MYISMLAIWYVYTKPAFIVFVLSRIIFRKLKETLVHRGLT